MGNDNDSDDGLIIYCDDRYTASPEELAQHPLTEEEEKKLDAIVERVFAKFGLVAQHPKRKVKSITSKRRRKKQNKNLP